MFFFRYLKYFFYIAYNWNIRIAWFIIKYEIKGEKKYGINTIGIDELKSLEKKGIDIEQATIYMPISYYLLNIIFNQLTNLPKQHFLDIGSGKGRALCVAAHFGFLKVSGIDFSKTLCADAEHNLKITSKKIPLLNYKIINNDAFYFEISKDVNCIFLFNPFNEIILSGVIKNIKKSITQYPRKVNIIYANPIYLQEFKEAGFKEIFYTSKLKYLEVVILEN